MNTKEGGDKMLSKNKALYQVKLILDYLPEEEYKLIPKETIDYIEENFEYDENFSINPNIPLEKQKIDDKAYEMLDEIVKSTELTKKENNSINSEKINEYLQEVKESNQNYNAKIENIKLKNLVEMLKKENSKIPKAKDLLSEYRDVLKEKDAEIERLKNNNQELYNCIQKFPKLIKKIFLKDVDTKLLKK